MATARACLPNWIHTIANERTRASHVGYAGREFAKSGCKVNSAGVVPCSPESLRAYTEAAVKALGLYPLHRKLSLDAYSIARNVRSEAGSGSVPEKVAMALAAIERARIDKKSISAVTMKNGELYARQSGVNPAVASSKDPTWEEIVIAELALNGDFDDFTHGATHYFSPNAMDSLHRKTPSSYKDRFGTYATWTGGWGSTRDGMAWVGPIPGINHHEQFLMRRVLKSDPYWKQQYDAGLAALKNYSRPPEADALPCSVEPSAPRRHGALLVATVFTISALAAGSVAAFLGARRMSPPSSRRRGGNV
jgi:hypothetical protein